VRVDGLTTTVSAPERAWFRSALERGIALGYGHGYDGVVASFRPHVALMDVIADYVARSLPPTSDRGSARIADVACGTGTLAFRLARDGYCVVGFDSVEPLIDAARRRQRRLDVPNVAFRLRDIGGAEPAGRYEAFDVVVSLHTLYWHPAPARMLATIRALLKPDAHAVILNYARPARVMRTFAQLYSAEGLASAVHALRWLVPTALFESLRDVCPRYTERDEFRSLLTQAGFELLEVKRVFLAGISLLAWLRRADDNTLTIKNPGQNR
jgi:2-polyprenyl-3-methyl-5-hydroxy-6-metoxy-1,4-benzoquinol methylase